MLLVAGCQDGTARPGLLVVPCAEGGTRAAPDADGDHLPAPLEGCTATVPTDCDDHDASVSQLFPDADGDGYRGKEPLPPDACTGVPGALGAGAPEDCDDAIPTRNAGAPEVCDGIDNDCDDLADGDDPSVTGADTWYVDDDDDGYGTEELPPISACGEPDRASKVPGDCDDADAAANPDAIEVCDGIDNDCDDRTDDEDRSVTGADTWYPDEDGDGYGVSEGGVTRCEPPEGSYATAAGDCDDTNGSIHPGAGEFCNGLDDDCDGSIDGADAIDASIWYPDADDDGHGAPYDGLVSCSQPEGYSSSSDDCDDANSQVHPGAPRQCNGKDNDCDGLVDANVPPTTFYPDGDSDGYGSSRGAIVDCQTPDGGSWVLNGSDCDDTDADVNPGAPEVCNGIDDDCDTRTDDADTDAPPSGTVAWYRDADGDTYGTPSDTKQACTPPGGYTSRSGDCDDSDAAIHPGAEESCDALDNDCDGRTDDKDTDSPPVDQKTYYQDTDRDGFGDPAASMKTCSSFPLIGYVPNSADCDDRNAAVHPGATEICNGIDDDCDGQSDEGLGATTWYRDADGDTYGAPQNTTTSCTTSPPTGYVGDDTDCDDSDAQVNPSGTEFCNTVDDDCDGLADEGVTLTFYRDEDGDGFGTASSTIEACTPPPGYAANDVDCDDADGFTYPGASEHCGYGNNNDCDHLGEIPENGGGCAISGDIDLTTSADLVIVGSSISAGAQLGRSVALTGDVDDDRGKELLIGAPLEDPDGRTDAGAVYLLRSGRLTSGSGPITLSAELAGFDAKLEGEAAGDQAGFALSSAGDFITVDGARDGKDDLLIGAPYADYGSSRANAGAVYLVDGTVTGLRSLAGAGSPENPVAAKLQGAATGELAGRAVSYNPAASSSDVAALFIGAPFYVSDQGRVYVVTQPLESTTGAVVLNGSNSIDRLKAFELRGEPGSYTGWSISPPGDVNGSSPPLHDLLIGGIGSSTTGGRAYLVFDAATRYSTGATYQDLAPISSRVTLPGQNQFGFALTCAGDLEGDGFDDVVIGAPLYDDTSTDIGIVHLYHGDQVAAGGFPPVPDAAFPGADADDRLGYATAVGDLNGDDLADLAIAASRAELSGTGNNGVVQLYYGRSSGLSPTPDAVLTGGSSDEAGTSLAIGDIDGDGLEDLVIGAPGLSTPNFIGRVYILYGRSY
jgi:hypothetical protein